MKVLRNKHTQPDPTILKGKQVCIVEDDPDQIDIIRSMLEGTGSYLEIFTTGEDALTWLMAREADLILADVMMPGLDGWELHSRIRENGPNQSTPLIFTTCVINRNQEALMSDIPAQTLSLAKPFDRNKLLKAVSRLLG